jgi:hypothetical protein
LRKASSHGSQQINVVSSLAIDDVYYRRENIVAFIRGRAVNKPKSLPRKAGEKKRRFLLPLSLRPSTKSKASPNRGNKPIFSNRFAPLADLGDLEGTQTWLRQAGKERANPPSLRLHQGLGIKPSLLKQKNSTA